MIPLPPPITGAKKKRAPKAYYNTTIISINIFGSEECESRPVFRNSVSRSHMNRTKKTWTQEIDERFLQAVLEGNLEQVKSYAEKGADLYQMDEEGTPKCC